MTKKYLRMTLNERFQHINLAVNFTLLSSRFCFKLFDSFLGFSYHRSSNGNDLSRLSASASAG